MQSELKKIKFDDAVIDKVRQTITYVNIRSREAESWSRRQNRGVSYNNASINLIPDGVEPFQMILVQSSNFTWSRPDC